MTTSAMNAHGTLLKLGDGAMSEAFTTIAEVLDINGPNLARGSLDATSHSSGGWKEKVAGIKDGGQVTFDINWVPGNATHANSTGLLSFFDDGEAHNFQLVENDASTLTWSFAAICTGFTTTKPVDGIRKGSITLDITGAVTYPV